MTFSKTTVLIKRTTLYTRLRQKFDRETLEGLDANALIWRLFMSTTLEAAAHWETNYWENLHAFRNRQDRTIQQLFSACQKMIDDRWTYTSLYVFSDSVQCVGKRRESWDDLFRSTPHYTGLGRIDGEPMEFEWTILVGNRA